MHPSWISICPRFHQHESSPICLQLLACFQMPWRSKLPLLRLFVLLTSVERCKVLSESCQSRLAVQNDRVKSQMVRPTEILDRIIFIGPPTHQIYRIYQSIAKQCDTTLFHLVSSRFIPFPHPDCPAKYNAKLPCHGRFDACSHLLDGLCQNMPKHSKHPKHPKPWFWLVNKENLSVLSSTLW